MYRIFAKFGMVLDVFGVIGLYYILILVGQIPHASLIVDLLLIEITKHRR